MVGSWLILTIISLSKADPNVFLPINSQVPPVARANQPFNFQFAQSTFTSSAGAISYIISNGPKWLQLESGSRTFSGTPAISDAGSFVVDLVASDSSGSTMMPVTFVVSTSMGPGLGISVVDQLSTHNGFSSPDSLLLRHSTVLSLSFSSDTFTNTNGNTLYYALCANNTPLPSWINFDPNDLSFSGTAPLGTSLAELPTTYTIELTASDVAGFAGAVATFSIVVESHMFAFGSSVQIFNVTSGSPVNFTALQSSLALNSQQVNSSVIQSASATTPSWLSLDPKTLDLWGTPPQGVTSQNITVNVTDIYGDIACTTVWLQTASDPSGSAIELLGPVATLTACNGTWFDYDLNRTLTNTNATVNVHLGDAWTWLTFDAGSLELKGQVPSGLKPQQYMINVTASLGSQSQSQVLTIEVQSSQAAASATGKHGSPTGVSLNGNGSSAADASSGGGALHDKRWIALPVVLPIVVLLTALILFCCRCCRRRKKNVTYECGSSNNSSKLHVPIPIHHEKNPGVEEAAIMSGAVDSGSKRNSARSSRPPILDIPGVWKPYTGKRNSQFRASQASADGGGRASRADSWQRYTMNFNVRPPSAALHGTQNSIADEKMPQKMESPSRYKSKSNFPRFSVSTRSSPTRDDSGSRQTRSNISFGSSALVSSHMSGLGLGHGRSIPSQSSGGIFSGTKGIGHGDGGGPPGYGTVRDSWRNFRLMHLRSIDGGSSNESDLIGCILPAPRAKGSNSPDKSSIRLVPSSSHRYKRGSIGHHRRSTIQTLSTVHSSQPSSTGNHQPRTRRDPQIDPLQEFHRRRLLLKNTERALFAAGPSEASRKSSHYTSSLPRTPSKGKFNRKLRRQSSIDILPSTPEDHARHHGHHSGSDTSSLISPLHSSPSKSSRPGSPHRPSHLRHNTHSTGNGIRLPLMGRGGSRKTSLMSDDQDSRWESASSDAASMDPYIYSREANNGGRETYLFDTQSEAGKPSPIADSAPFSRMETFARGLKGLSWDQAKRGRKDNDDDHPHRGGDVDGGAEQEKGRGWGRWRDEERVKVVGEKGKRGERGMGVPKGEKGNMSFRGDLRRVDDDGASAFV